MPSLSVTRLLRYGLALICLGASGVAGAAADAAVAVLLSERSATHEELSEALKTEIERGSGAMEIPVTTDLSLLPRPPTRLLVTVGSNAFLAAVNAEIKTPILATLLPRAAFDRIVEVAGRHGSRTLSAVVLDQPVGRQLDLIHIALPDKTRIGVVLGSESQALAGELQAAAAERDLHLETSRASGTDDIFHALQRLFGNSEVLLAEPDPTVFNGATIQNILLSTYRVQMPLIGFSPAYVKAGALVALYSTPAQIGVQAGDIARAVLAGKAMPPPQSPREFSVGTNAHVAHSLGLHIDAADVLSEKLHQLERRQ
jgi:putative ABC transport system substrate-binding protein